MLLRDEEGGSWKGKVSRMSPGRSISSKREFTLGEMRCTEKEQMWPTKQLKTMRCSRIIHFVSKLRWVLFLREIGKKAC
jgi:hypothetical protein